MNKRKQTLTLAVGIIVGFAVSLAGLSFASNMKDETKIISEEKAKRIMLNEVPEAKLVEFSYDGDELVPKYDGTLMTDDAEYEIDVDAVSGKIIKFEKEEIFIIDDNTSNSTEGNINNNTNTGNNTSNSTEGNINNNTNIGNNTNNSTSNNTSDGNSNNNSTVSGNSNSSSTYIGEQKAKQIMLNKVPGANIVSFHFDRDETPEYEGELRKGNMEYDISVDAKTGKIKEFSKEVIDNDDND